MTESARFILAASSKGPDPLARWLAIAALTVSVMSLLLAWRAYWRGGARVRVLLSVDYNVAITFVNQAIYGDQITVTAQNRGMATVQVTSVFIQVEGVDKVHEIANSHVLEGYHEHSWTDAPGAVVALIKQGDPAVPVTSRRIRAGVKLASGRRRTSRWTRMPARPAVA